MPLRLIGAGPGRTGTRTLKAVLEDLGWGPCYHMTDLFQQPERVVHWEDAAAGRPVDWEALFAGYAAVVDHPGCQFWKTLCAVYPEARVLLTVRDPDAWYDSVLATIFPASRGGAPPDPANRIHHLMWRSLWQGTFEGRFTDRGYATDWFRAHIETVRREVPAERLLVYEVAEGWEPLCGFLGVEVPDRPFPHLNTRAAFLERLDT